MKQFLATCNMGSTCIGITLPQFNPDKHPHATLKAFNEFIEQFEFRYSMRHTQPSRNVLENAISKWKALNNEGEPAKKDKEKEWVSKDKVFLSSSRLQQDWKGVEPNPELLINAE